jgi:hypothetical protein
MKGGFALSVEIDPLECIEMVPALELDLLTEGANLGAYAFILRVRRKWCAEGISENAQNRSARSGATSGNLHSPS